MLADSDGWLKSQRLHERGKTRTLKIAGCGTQGLAERGFAVEAGGGA